MAMRASPFAWISYTSLELVSNPLISKKDFTTPASRANILRSRYYALARSVASGPDFLGTNYKRCEKSRLDFSMWILSEISYLLGRFSYFRMSKETTAINCLPFSVVTEDRFCVGGGNWGRFHFIFRRTSMERITASSHPPCINQLI